MPVGSERGDNRRVLESRTRRLDTEDQQGSRSHLIDPSERSPFLLQKSFGQTAVWISTENYLRRNQTVIAPAPRLAQA